MGKTKRAIAGNPTLAGFDSVPDMPEDYYVPDGPNENLAGFVQRHANAYDAESDGYDEEAFTSPITTTKASVIYNMHTYWSKKPHDAIQQYIRHYTDPGDVVLDPFCGSGSTCLAALIEGRPAIAIDRSPAATFITANYCSLIGPQDLDAAFQEAKRICKRELDWLYETRCDECGAEAVTTKLVYSNVFQCPRCMTGVPLIDCVEV